MTQKNFNKLITIGMGILCIVVIGFVLHINFSYYFHFLHADISADLAFAREAVRTRSLFPQGWLHLNEMRFFYITTPIALLYILLGNINMSYKIVVSIMLFLNIFLFWWAFKIKRLVTFFIGIIVLFLGFSGYYLFSVFDILWINATLSTHIATILFTLGVYIRIYNNEKIQKWLVVLAIIFAFLQGIQSIRVTIALYFPIIFLSLYPLTKDVFLENKFSFSNISKSQIFSSQKFSLALFVANFIGIILIQFFIRNGSVLVGYTRTTTGLRLSAARDIFNGDLMFSLAGILESLQLHGDIYVFSQLGILHLARLVFLATIIILFLKIKKTSANQQMFLLLLSSLVFLFLSQLISQDIGMGGRINFTITFLVSFMAFIVLEELLATKQNFLATLYISFISFVVLVSMNNFGLYRNYELVQDRQQVANFIIEQGLTLGYGHFWTGTPIAAVGNYNFVVIPLQHTESIFGYGFSQGISAYDFSRQVDRSFIVAPAIEFYWAVQLNETIAELTTQGDRHQFGDIVLYIFDFDPFEIERIGSPY